VASAEVAGPGFINVKLSARGAVGASAAGGGDARSGAGRVADAAARGDGFWRLERRQGNAHRPPALDGDRGQLQRLFRFMGDA
jgi:hypothetical protein